MKSKIPKIEELYPIDNQIDTLDLANAFDMMLNDQAKVFDIINKDKNNILSIIDFLTQHLSQFEDSRLIYCGAGTSGRIAVQDAVELYPTFGWPRKRIDFILAGGIKSLQKSVENAEDDIIEAKKNFIEKKIKRNDVIICIAASGNTKFTNEILKMSSRSKIRSIAISNNPDGIILKNSDFQIVLNTQQEVIAGSTRLKAGTAQKICLNIISTLVMTKLGNVKNGMMINMIPSNEKLKKRMSRIKKMNETSNL